MRSTIFSNYIIKLKHDDGVIRIGTVTNRVTAAVRAVLNHELAPFSSIIEIRKQGELYAAKRKKRG